MQQFKKFNLGGGEYFPTSYFIFLFERGGNITPPFYQTKNPIPPGGLNSKSPKSQKPKHFFLIVSTLKGFD